MTVFGIEGWNNRIVKRWTEKDWKRRKKEAAELQAKQGWEDFRFHQRIQRRDCSVELGWVGYRGSRQMTLTLPIVVVGAGRDSGEQLLDGSCKVDRREVVFDRFWIWHRNGEGGGLVRKHVLLVVTLCKLK